jgi:hypothetical protein
VRFIKGFSKAALDFLLQVVSAWGKEGWADKPFPLTRTILMSHDILTSDAFCGKKDKDWKCIDAFMHLCRFSLVIT